MFIAVGVLALACACAWSAATTGAAPASPLEPRFTQVGATHIPRDVVASLAQDRLGLLWIATGDGLVRHDGHRFRPVERDITDPARRNLGWIRALLSGSDSRMWIGTETDGLLAWNPQTDALESHRDPAAAGGPLPTIRALAQAADGTLWIGTHGGGLVHYDPAQRRYTPVPVGDDGEGPAASRIQALLVDRQGGVWVGTWRGLMRRQAGARRFEPVPMALQHGLPRASAGVQALLQASDGRVWLGLSDGRVGRLDPDPDASVQWLAATGESNPAVTALVEAPGSVVWAGRAAGVDLFDVASGTWQRRLRHDPRNTASLGAGEVTALVRDRDDAIWVGGFGLGLQRHDPTRTAIAVRAPDADPAGLLQDADVRHLLATRDGRVWAAPASGGVVILDDQLHAIGHARLLASGGQPRVEAMAEAGDGRVWLASGGWLYAMDRQRRVVARLRHDGGNVHRMRTAADGGIWIGTQVGVWRLDADGSTMSAVAGPGGQPFPGDVFDVATAADGGLWVATVSGLYRMAPGARTLEPVAAQAGAELGNPIVIGLLVDRKGVLWLDTSVAGLHRLARWDGRTAAFERVSLQHGIANRPFGANLHEDERGRIWTQMYVYDPAHRALREITAADGAAFGTPWFLSTAKLRDGRLLFGGSKGVLVVQPSRFELAPRTARPVVASVRVEGRRLPLTAEVRDRLVLESGQRSFAVDLTTLDYSDPQRVRYRYRLDGIDRDWIDASADAGVASYAGIGPGRYVLRVGAAHPAGPWGSEELAWPVHVQPAWWQHPLTRAVMAILVLALAALALRWRVHRLVHRQRQLEIQVHERTRELEEASLTDPLTGLRNRRYFTEHIDADVAWAVRRHDEARRHARAAADDADLVFVLVDIDHFKRVNDLHGHAAGDVALRHVARCLQGALRESDTLVRWGGEEFLVVARGLARAWATELAERVRRSVHEQPLALPDGTELRCTVSVGFAAFPMDPGQPQAQGWSDAIRVADAALYLAKRAGRDGWAGVVGTLPGHELDPQERRPAREWLASGELALLRSTPRDAPSGRPETG
jgi:diguanylate cyclase (GGDEF)-like protein